MHLNIKNNLKYARLSNDFNPIHISKKEASNFFIKLPILHGTNITSICLNKYNRGYSLKKVFGIKIFFKNFINIDEKFNIQIKKNFINVSNTFEKKIEISIKKKKIKNNKYLNYKKIIDELKFITYYVSNIKPGKNSLIHQITFDSIDNKSPKRNISIRKINKNIYYISYNYNNIGVSFVTSKMIPFKRNYIIRKLPKYIQKKIKNKKILIFGKSGDVANQIVKCLPKSCSIYSCGIKNVINLVNLKSFLKKKIIFFKPDFIFYLSSPKIIHGHSKSLEKFYSKVYFYIFKIILNLLINNKIYCKVFYPSSIAVKHYKKYNYLKSYISAKIAGENLCKEKKFKGFAKCYRLPQFKSRSNYNIIGKYEGVSLNKLNSYLIKFFNN